jgi:hypothetical protein
MLALRLYPTKRLSVSRLQGLPTVRGVADGTSGGSHRHRLYAMRAKPAMWDGSPPLRRHAEARRPSIKDGLQPDASGLACFVHRSRAQAGTRQVAEVQLKQCRRGGCAGLLSNDLAAVPACRDLSRLRPSTGVLRCSWGGRGRKRADFVLDPLPGFHLDDCQVVLLLES